MGDRCHVLNCELSNKSSGLLRRLRKPAGLKPEHADLPFFLIMISTGKNADFIFFDFINQAVFLVDASGPAPGKFMF